MVYVALLRAVNVSAHNKIPMADLREVLEGLGLREVRTYLQSGNAVFEADETPPGQIAEAIEGRIERDLGPRVGVVVLPARELGRVVEENPFAEAPAVDLQWLHATFLFGGASESDFGAASDEAFSAAFEAAFRKLEVPAELGEQAAFVGVPALAVPVVYLYLPNGYGRSKLNNAYFERSLGAAATTRSWRTVLALVEMSEGRRR